MMSLLNLRFRNSKAHSYKVRHTISVTFYDFWPSLCATTTIGSSPSKMFKRVWLSIYSTSRIAYRPRFIIWFCSRIPSNIAKNSRIYISAERNSGTLEANAGNHVKFTWIWTLRRVKGKAHHNKLLKLIPPLVEDSGSAGGKSSCLRCTLVLLN